MIQQDHLQVYELRLETKSPVFIGNGKSYAKKEYLFDPKRRIVSFIDEQKFFTYLVQHGLTDVYENFILRDAGKNLYSFLQNDCQISRSDMDALIRCRIDAADALDEDHTLKEIRQFIRNSSGQVYIPGSSIKGALRTTLLKAVLLESPPKNPDPNIPFDRRATFESEYFHTLSLKDDKGNPLNSILRGLRVSDSMSIPDRQLCLTRKIDEFTDHTYNSINVCRESIRPGTVVMCTLTLDQSILQSKLSVDTIRQAIAAVSQFHQDSVLRLYPQASNYMNSRTILLGGGVGFQSKTVTAPYYGQNGLDISSKILDKAFPKHQHKRDASEGISPRALKQTDFGGTSYPFGVCEVTIR